MKKILFAALALTMGISACVKDNPFIGISNVAHTPGSVTPDDAVTVTATTTGVKSADLIYTVDNGIPQTVAMTLVSDGSGTFIGAVFTGVIPAQADGAKVVYHIVGKGDGGSARSDNKEYTVSTVVIDYTLLVLNEIDGNGKFVEIYNKGAVAIPLTGVTLVKNESETWWTGGAGVTIAAGGRYSIAQTGSSVTGVDEFTGASGISARQNLKFELKDPAATVLDTFLRTNGGALKASVTPDYSLNMADGGGGIYSFSRTPDGTGTFNLATPTPGAANGASAGPIVTNPS